MVRHSYYYMFEGSFPQVLASFIGSIGAISDGMQYGWSAPVVPILQSPDSPVEISDGDVDLLEGLYLIGGIAGLPLTIYMIDKIGRHKSIMASAITGLVAWMLIGMATSPSYLYVARYCAGWAADVAFVATPMYIAEIADQKIRGFLASAIYLMMLIGVLMIYSIAPFVPFVVPSLVGGGLLVLQLVVFPFMPESPYYLLDKKQVEAARRALQWLRNTANVADELEEIRLAVERQKSEHGKPQDLILVKNNRKALLIIGLLNGAQHFSGISVILMNLHSILERAGSIYVNSSTAAIIFSGIMLIAGTTSSFIVDKYGRKILLVISSISSGLCLFILSAYFYLKNHDVDVETISWIPIVSVMIYAATFKIGLGIVPMVLTAELFSAKVKAMGMTIADAIYVIFSLLSVLLYQYLTQKFGIHVPFIIFASCTIFAAIFSLLYIPETKGKTLDEIQLQLKGETTTEN